MKHQCIVIFTRYPEAGKCKTRLIPILGVEGAADLQRCMTAWTINMAKGYTKKEPDCNIEISFHGGSNELMAETFGKADYRSQPGGNLGRRMFHALNHAFLEGFRSIMIIGSDCPDISAEILQKAFHCLKQYDLVLGPAQDGGYYLIGLKRPIYDLFPENMPWSTGLVLEKTLQIAKKLKLSVFLLPELADVDLPRDVARIWNTPLLQGIRQPLISIIIPALNEAPLILRTIEACKINNIEIIVADGGSTDETRELASKAGAKVVQCPRGRGNQLNKGVLHASGKIIIFLHADTILPEGFVSEVITILAKPGTVAGAFRLSITGKNWALGIVAFFTNLRSILFQLPYGDQAIFIQKDQFERAGGFPDIPIMEDYALVLCLKKMGRITISPKAVKTSGRRWDKLGYLKTLLINQAMIIGYHAGVSIERLEKFYLQHKPHQKEKITIEV